MKIYNGSVGGSGTSQHSGGDLSRNFLAVKHEPMQAYKMAKRYDVTAASEMPAEEISILVSPR